MGVFDWFTKMETAWAARRGGDAKVKLMRRYPRGIVCTVGEPFMARLKVRDSSWNYVAWRGDNVPWLWRQKWACALAGIEVIPWNKLREYNRRPEVYEWVYQCMPEPRRGFVLSIFPEQIATLQGAKVLITKYGVISHFMHRLVIREDVEVYPQEWRVIDNGF